MLSFFEVRSPGLQESNSSTIVNDYWQTTNDKLEISGGTESSNLQMPVFSGTIDFMAGQQRPPLRGRVRQQTRTTNHRQEMCLHSVPEEVATNKPGGLKHPLPGLPSPGSHPTID